MKDSRHIVICGASIYMLAIESGLSAMVAGDVVRINPDLPNIIERISMLEPHVVIIERNEKNNALASEIQSHNIPLIVIDEARRSFKVLDRERVPNAEISQLTSVIEKINQEQEVGSGENLAAARRTEVVALKGA